MDKTVLLEADGLSHYYEDILCLDNASFVLHDGEALGIIGGNASSKTTLMRVLAGIASGGSGNVYVRGRDGVRHKIHSAADARKYGIVALHEASNVIEHLTIAENICFGLYSGSGGKGVVHGFIRRKQIINEARRVCVEFGFDIDVQKNAGILGYADRQIVSLLNAYLADARILLIDDVFSALGQQETDKVVSIIESFKRKNAAIVFLSQSTVCISRFADSIITIDNGRLSGKFAYTPESIQSCFQQKQRAYPKLNISLGDVLFSCEKLSYRDIIKGVSLQVSRGEILGILGAQGSGRTVLARLLGGDLSSEGGCISVCGTPVRFDSPVDARNHKISLTLDNRVKYGLIPALDLANNLMFPNYGALRSKPFSGAIVTRRKIHARAGIAVKNLEIRCNSLDQDIHCLSAGNQQKMLIARGLYSDSEVFILDEPTHGVDVAGRIQIYNLLGEICRNKKGIILLTSDVQEAIGMCDRILVLNNGVITSEFEKNNMNYAKIYDAIYSAG